MVDMDPASVNSTSDSTAVDLADQDSSHVRIGNEKLSLVLRAERGNRPSIVHWGPPLSSTTAEMLELLSHGQPAQGSALTLVRSTLSNEPGTGIASAPGLLVQRQGTAWTPDLRITDIRQGGDTRLVIVCRDDRCGIEVEYQFEIGRNSGVLTCRTVMTNVGDGPLAVEWCSAPILPVERRLTQITSYTGRWSGEFQTENVDRFRGTWLRENRAGRTSHDGFPAVLVSEERASETVGSVCGVHLAWSGNSRLRIDTVQDGRAFLQAGELLLPGEIVLEPADSYTSPELVASAGEGGFGPLSRAFTDHVSQAVLPDIGRAKPRPVHYNTWEAIYFDHDEAHVMRLAEQAAAVGAERFVLDDGWFGSRRNDQAGLGDWQVSREIYPKGLRPLADHVRSLGMEFGLWFEPEMVNPDSDLYRAHPDWILGVEGIEHVPFRNQLTLDLTRPEVTDYLFDQIAEVVEDAGVQYIKWDMNRDTVHPASQGRGAMHRQTHAVYSLIDRLRTKFPQLEIESCASGGARADYGVLARTDRIWVSDNNDALDRQTIQRNASHFIPLSAMGTHVGPRRCHITGRELTMEFRAATAMIGHMGMELDLSEETAEDRETLTQAIALHKKHRDLIHHGEFHRLEPEAQYNAVACIAADRSEALVSCAMLQSSPTSLPPQLRIPVLDEEARYRLRLVWPTTGRLPGGESIVQVADLQGDGLVVSGEALRFRGLQLPIMQPASCLIFHLERQS